MCNISPHQSCQDDKKYTKVSSALKCRLFRLIFVEKFTIKESAKICNMNYSTAKCVLKQITQKEQKYIENQVQLKKVNQKKHKWIKKKHCYYRALNKKQHETDDCTIDSSILVQPNLSKDDENAKIVIISTIGHDFFQIEDQHIQKSQDSVTQQRQEQTSIFFRKKSYQSIINIKKHLNQQSYVVPLYVKKNAQYSIYGTTKSNNL